MNQIIVLRGSAKHLIANYIKKMRQTPNNSLSCNIVNVKGKGNLIEFIYNGVQINVFRFEGRNLETNKINRYPVKQFKGSNKVTRSTRLVKIRF